MQETAISLQFVPGMRFLTFDFARYAMSGTDMGHATRCPVLTQAMPLRLRYAMSGTDAGHAATRLLLLLATRGNSAPCSRFS
eukprot:3444906-Rhodomonas_salina.3